MVNLLAMDFCRIIKDKLFWITAIIGGVFALITPLLYAALFHWIDQESMGKMLIGIAVDAKSQFFTAFHFGDNFGLVAPVLLAIVLCKDFSYGTVRNKIIGGYSRTKIYLSMLITCYVSLFTLMLCHALLTLGCSLLFFPYQEGGFDASALIYLLGSVGLQALCYLFVSALVCWLCIAMKNVGLTIVVYIAITFLLTLIVSAIQLAVAAVPNQTLADVLMVINQINPFYQVGVIGQGETYTLEQLLYGVLSPVVAFGLFLACGAHAFKKKDIC
ncbi:MAG: ABC transporter permease [Clostridia bacterium]|nr:ABC transporter permease [Clostridia bacterium]